MWPHLITVYNPIRGKENKIENAFYVYTYMCIYIYIFFSIMIYHRILNIVPCVICITESLFCIAVINKHCKLSILQ